MPSKGNRNTDDHGLPRKRRKTIDGYITVIVGGERFSFNIATLKKNCPAFLNKLQSLQESDGTVILEEDKNYFRIVYRFIIGDNIADISQDDVLQLYRMAEKFNIENIRNYCIEKTEQIIKRKNICWLMEFAHNNNLQELKDRCLTIIRQNLNFVLQNAEMLVNLCLMCVREVFDVNLERPEVIPEIDIFRALVKWAKNQSRGAVQSCQKELFGQVVDLVRIPRITTGQYYNEVRESGMLPDDLFIQYGMYFVTLHATRCVGAVHTVGNRNLNPPTREAVTFHICRFSGLTSGKYYVRDNHDAISFIVNRDLRLHGIMVFGSHQRPGSYNIELKILKEGTEIGCKFCTIRTDGQTRMYRLDLDAPLCIERDTCYTIDLLMKGIISYYGIGGQPHVSYNGVDITFIPNDNSLNNTNVQIGQIPTLIFEEIN